MTSCLGLVNLLEYRREHRETLTFISLLMDMIMETNGPLDEEMYWIGSGRVLCTGVSISVELECNILPLCVCVHQLGSCWNLSHLPHIGVINY